MFAKVLIVGNGGREHALAWKIAQSSQVQQVIVCPGNAGTREGAHPKISNLPVDSYDEIPQKSVDIGADLVIIGPEAPLADGLADRVRKVGVNVFGPSSKAAQIESSKAFCKKFMARHDIPSAEFEVFSDFSRARSYVESKFASGQKVVVKASGLAAGKGVVVPETAEDAINALKMMMVDRIFGSAADEVVIEDLLIGEEASVLAFSDGYSVALCPPAQDHKRLLDGDKGPNTGGMGAYAPTPLISQEMLDQIEKKVIQPTITGLRKEGIPFVGMLFAGLMICPDKGIQVLEFNCRFGDPETQVILPLLHTDLFSVMNACVDRCLDSVELKWAPEGTSAVTVVVASEGYPSVYPKGRVIDFSKTEAETLSTMIFHAGTSVSSEGQIITSGGRVLSVTSVSSSLDNALSEAYGHLSNISFEGMQYRSDIAQKAFRKSTQPVKSFSYRDCGVDIDAGNEAVKLMKAAVERTYGPEVLSGLGSFGGLFSAFRIKTLENPILVASTDGVGTKIKVASQLQRYDTIGHDIVNHCINDILVQGAIPLFFLDYIASSVIDPVMIATAVQGIASACEKSGCALIGGETAEMPGVYLPNEFDLAGTIIGLVDKSDLIDGQSIVPGDLVIGVKSSGLHTNGFSLARKVLDGLDWSSPNEELNGQSIGDVLLASHRPYLNEYLALKDSGISVKGMAHITGGGLIENPPRILPKTTTLEIFKGSWEVPPIFRMMQRLGNVNFML